MYYKIIAVDLDGTLFTDDKTVLPETAEALKKAAENGLHIIPATGRPYSGLTDTVLSMGFFDYAITANGAAVYRISDRKCIYEAPLPPQKAADILCGLRRFEISVDVFANGNAYKEKNQLDVIDKLPMTDKMKNYIRNTRIYVDDMPKFFLDSSMQVQKITLNFFGDGKGGSVHREETAAYLKGIDGITVVCGGDNNLEISAAGVSKGTALLKTAEFLGADPSQTIAFGDSGNDLDIIKAAGIGIAMGNGTEEIKAAADMITLSNNENGIAKALKQLIINSYRQQNN